MNKVLYDSYKVCKKKIDMYIDKYDGVPYAFSSSKSGDYYSDSEVGTIYERGFTWITSFITGLGPLMYKVEHDDKYIKWANRFKHDYKKVIFEHAMEMTHDIGFLYSPYSVALYKITGDPEHREIALKAADELAKRFNINSRCIQAWGRMDEEYDTYRVIIDTMMNLPLLFWAWEETGHKFYRDVAKAHCDTVMKLHVRNDFSMCHAFQFDKETGEIIGEINSCGYDNGSYWARGTAWAIYGYAIAARYLKCEKYFNLATKIAEKYISSIPDGGCVPPWDFRLPKDMPAKVYGSTSLKPENRIVAEWDETKKENCKFNVDSSASAIVVCGLIELNKFKKNEEFSKFIDASLEELCKDYLNKDLSIQGLLKRQNGEDAYTLYGDYFFAEALVSRMFNSDVPW